MKPTWIWLPEREYLQDTYAGFKTEFQHNGGKLILRVASDSIYAAYINGEVALFSGCADYPHYKLYDEIDVTSLAKECNDFYLIVWHHGISTQTYISDTPGAWFEIVEDGITVAASGTETLSRLERNYKQDYCKLITHQLGFSFYYDNAVENTDEYLPSIAVEKKAPIKRPQKPLYLDGRIPATYTNKGDHVLVDLGREVAGYADLEFDSPIEQELLFTYGEHLEIGKVSRDIDGRDFSFEFKARKGKNKWFIPLRRLACRYIEVYFKKPISIGYIGMQHVYYPVTVNEKHFDDELLSRIYNVSVRTLRLCMHEHYEDCPWREQALYALDSRNQMLFGYHAFGETEYPRSNLLLINQGLRPDGLLPICFPAGRDVPIPFFSIAYILEVCEYVKYSGDRSLLKDTEQTIKTIIRTFESKMDKNGLIPEFPAPYWNFYEWSEGNDGNLSGVGKTAYVEDYHLNLNAFFVYVVNKYNEIAGTSYDTEKVKNAIHRELYDAERGEYRISVNGSLYGQLGNSLAVLAGLGTPALLEKLITDKTLTPATLSMKPFLYDALLTDREKYKDFVLEDIKNVYKKMLDYGATSFWETELGWEDFNYAGSLCHGWSASPAYYLDILGCTK